MQLYLEVETLEVLGLEEMISILFLKEAEETPDTLPLLLSLSLSLCHVRTQQEDYKPGRGPSLRTQSPGT